MNRFIYIAIVAMNENLSKIYSFFPEKGRERKKRGRKYEEVIRRISRRVPSEIFFTFNGHQRQTPPFRFSRLGFGLETTRPWNRRDSPVSMERHKVTEIVNFEKPIFRTVPHSRKEVVRYHSLEGTQRRIWKFFVILFRYL